MALDEFGLRAHIISDDGASPCGGEGKSAEHTHGGGLTGSVGTEEAENLATIDIERYMVYGCERAELLGQIANGYDRSHLKIENLFLFFIGEGGEGVEGSGEDEEHGIIEPQFGK
jgi:hypothetical protein